MDSDSFVGLLMLIAFRLPGSGIIWYACIACLELENFYQPIYQNSYIFILEHPQYNVLSF